jgi:hypothetical protein
LRASTCSCAFAGKTDIDNKVIMPKQSKVLGFIVVLGSIMPPQGRAENKVIAAMHLNVLVFYLL